MNITSDIEKNNLTLYKLPAGAAYVKYGITSNTLHQLLSNIHDLSLYRDCLETYYLNYWSAKYILKDSDGGMIYKDNNMYHIVYLKPVTRGKILASVQAGNSLQQYKLSFRKALPEFNLPAYVLISECH